VDYVVNSQNTEDAYTGETTSIEDGRVTPIRSRARDRACARYAFNLHDFARDSTRLPVLTSQTSSGRIASFATCSVRSYARVS